MDEKVTVLRPNLFSRATLTTGMIVGLVGGAAEVVWIGLFAGIGGGTASDVARGVTETVAPALAAGPGAIAFGIAVHFALAAILGVAVVIGLGRVFPKLAGTLTEAAMVVALLAAIWAINFLVILPVVNPGFVHIVALPVSFVSKLLFGVTAAFVLRMRSHPVGKKSA